MRGLKLVCAALALSLLCACGKQIKNYRVYNDLIISFTEALGDRTLESEKLTKSEDGRKIIAAEYTYKSNQADEDKENYLYYMLNHKGATFIADNTVAIDSSDRNYVIVVKTSSEGNKFTINITREEL